MGDPRRRREQGAATFPTPKSPTGGRHSRFVPLSEDATVAANIGYAPSLIKWGMFPASVFYEKGVTPKNQNDFGKGQGSALVSVGG